MRISFTNIDDETKSDILDVFAEVRDAVPFDEISVSFGDACYEYDGHVMKIFLDHDFKDFPEFAGMDFLRKLFLATHHKNGHITELDFADEIVTGDNAIMHGFKDRYFLYNFDRMKKIKKINSLEEMLFLVSLYTVFHRHDRHDYDYLKSAAKMLKIDNIMTEKAADIIDAMHNDGSVESSRKLAEVYRRMKENGVL